MVRARKFTVAKIFDGEIKESDLRLEEEELPPIDDGEFLVECLHLSVDPYMRAYATNYKEGQLMIGVQLGAIVESRNPSFPVGELVVGNLGWRTHTIVGRNHDYFLYVLPDLGNLPRSIALGVLGPPGVASYFGFLEICQPARGETVVVSAAAGACGSYVGQVAKLKGCRVVGICGSEDKVRWLRSLGFDHVINYKTTKNLAEDLKKGAPNGIDCYFDNVGGNMSTIVMELMNTGGRVAVCGSISSYNSKVPLRAAIVQPAIVRKQLKVQGFISTQFRGRWFEGWDENIQWLREKKIKYRETITDGFENATRALIGVMRGENIGKAVVKVKASSVENESLDFKDALDKFRQIQAR